MTAAYAKKAEEAFLALAVATKREETVRSLLHIKYCLLHAALMRAHNAVSHEPRLRCDQCGDVRWCHLNHSMQGVPLQDPRVPSSTLDRCTGKCSRTVPRCRRGFESAAARGDCGCRMLPVVSCMMLCRWMARAAWHRPAVGCRTRDVRIVACCGSFVVCCMFACLHVAT